MRKTQYSETNDATATDVDYINYLFKEMNKTQVKSDKDLKRIMELNKWVCVSSKKHEKFQRNVLLKGEKNFKKQTYIKSVSPSNCSNYYRYSMRILKQQNENVDKII